MNMSNTNEMPTSFTIESKCKTVIQKFELLAKRAKKGEEPERYYGIKLNEEEQTQDNLTRLIKVFGLDLIFSKLIMQLNLELQKLNDKCSTLDELKKRIHEQDFHDRKASVQNAYTQFQTLNKKLMSGEPLSSDEQKQMRELMVQMQSQLAAAQLKIETEAQS